LIDYLYVGSILLSSLILMGLRKMEGARLFCAIGDGDLGPQSYRRV